MHIWLDCNLQIYTKVAKIRQCMVKHIYSIKADSQEVTLTPKKKNICLPGNFCKNSFKYLMYSFKIYIATNNQIEYASDNKAFDILIFSY